MIANERQYRITKAWAERFARGAAQAAEPGDELPVDMQHLYREAYESQVEELQAQLAEYEALQSGQVSVIEAHSLSELPEALIRARIATGLTQKQLAARLGLKEQQVQRYEATRYRGVSLDRVQEVADALGVQIQERVILPSANGE
jgi:ribosome-binding protein aMBF1 (putative translation factor)